MGRTFEKVKVRNYGDIAMVARGLLKEEAIREAEIEAIVDTGATYLCLPPKIIEELGLLYSRSVSVTTANGEVKRRIFQGAEITIKNRSTQMEVMESDETTPPLIGFLVLEALDFVVDPKTQKIIPNPEHGGKWVVECYRQCVPA
jgi:clan AA aspartic protease